MRTGSLMRGRREYYIMTRELQSIDSFSQIWRFGDSGEKRSPGTAMPEWRSMKKKCFEICISTWVKKIWCNAEDMM